MMLTISITPREVDLKINKVKKKRQKQNTISDLNNKRRKKKTFIYMEHFM